MVVVVVKEAKEEVVSLSLALMRTAIVLACAALGVDRYGPRGPWTATPSTSITSS